VIDDMKGRKMVTCGCTSVKSCHNVKQSRCILQYCIEKARTIFKKQKKHFLLENTQRNRVSDSQDLTPKFGALRGKNGVHGGMVGAGRREIFCLRSKVFLWAVI
jgi:hypothetical protein